MSDIQELLRRRREYALRYCSPYPWQWNFLNARDDNGALADQILLRCGNQCGKTWIGGIAVAYHATGLYPKEWEGKRFRSNVMIWVGGNTIPNTRDLCQAELLGEPGDASAFGTGSIPRHLIGRQTKYHGIPDALQSVLVRHVSGRSSKIIFKAYEQGKEAWMGKGVHVVWGDEEMPYDIYSQCLRATLKKSGIIFMTATPENGMTKMMNMFTNERVDGQAMITATWDDAPHLDEATKRQRLASLLPFEREMRSKGIPVLGSGLIWPVPESEIMCDPFSIPSGWKKIAGIDFAGAGTEGHPSALVAMAIDPDTGTSYIYDTYRESGKSIPQHWLSMKRIGAVPIAWPHDGMVSDRGSGISYAQQYMNEGANMLPEKFSNPPQIGKKEGTGGNGVKAGLTAILAAMEQGRFKVFSNQVNWFEEFRGYYQKDGEIVKDKDDLMSATRYAFMSQRFALDTSMDFSSYIPDQDDYSDAVVGY